MSNGSGKEYFKCADLIQENIDLKQSNASLKDVLEQYKTMLEERNGQLKTVLQELSSEQAKKRCACFLCKFCIWVGMKN
jgi:hypothetical protein